MVGIVSVPSSEIKVGDLIYIEKVCKSQSRIIYCTILELLGK